MNHLHNLCYSCCLIFICLFFSGNALSATLSTTSSTGASSSAQIAIVAFSSSDTTQTETSSYIVTDSITINAQITPGSQDIGQTAVIYIVASYNNTFYIKDNKANWQTWDVNFSSLTPAENTLLTQNTNINIISGLTGLAGNFVFYIGYRPVNSNDIIYNETGYSVTVNDDSVVTSKLKDAFFAIHIETSDHNTQSDTVKDEWHMLEGLIDLANKDNHKLTLEFQAQWAEYALQNPDKLTQIRAWETQGHEIAFHHHGVSHAAWDGYTNATGFENDPKYRGTIDDAIALVNQLPESGQVKTGGITDEETDWPEGLIYATGGSGKSGGGLLSTPTQQTYGNQTVMNVTNQGYALETANTVQLSDIESAIQQAKIDEVLGVVTHPFDYHNNTSAFDDLFSLYKKYGITLKTVSSILSSASTD